MKYAVVTFGCRVNQADSFELEADLLARGDTPAPLAEADLVIVNTCSVTASADQGARQTIRRVSRSNPSARIVVTGCYATRAPHEVSSLPNVLRVLGNDEKAGLVDLVRGDLDIDTARRFGDGEGGCGAAVEPGVAGRTAFTLRVQTGCREACAYCIIPSTRGEPRSVPVAAVLEGLTRAADQSFKEVAITGVHLGSYGRDLSPPVTLLDLLAAIDRAVAPDLRVRISSLEPMDCPPELVELVARSRVFAPHFHLPLQHASDRMLGLMRRSYSLDQYARLVDRIRYDLPDASIGTDLIVGFPGETDADFEALAGYLERSPITHAHVFPYSDRPGTIASTMAGKVGGLVTRERAGRIRAIATTRTAAFQRGQIGRVHRSLTLEDGTLVVTGNYLKVRIPHGHARNEWLDVRLTEVDQSLVGAVVGDEPVP